MSKRSDLSRGKGVVIKKHRRGRYQISRAFRVLIDVKLRVEWKCWEIHNMNTNTNSRSYIIIIKLLLFLLLLLLNRTQVKNIIKKNKNNRIKKYWKHINQTNEQLLVSTNNANNWLFLCQTIGLWNKFSIILSQHITMSFSTFTLAISSDEILRNNNTKCVYR